MKAELSLTALQGRAFSSWLPRRPPGGIGMALLKAESGTGKKPYFSLQRENIFYNFYFGGFFMHAFSMPYTKRLLMTLVLLMSICAFPGSLPQAVAQETEEEGDPAEITIGERLFLETRFSQFPLYTGEPLPQLSMSKAVSTIPCRRVENPHPTPVL